MPDETVNTTAPTFTEEQQAHVRNLIQENVRHSLQSVQTEKEALATKLSTLERELSEVKTTKPSNKEGNKAKGEDIEALQREIAEMRNASQSTVEEVRRLRELSEQKDALIRSAKEDSVKVRKEAALSRAAEKLNFFNPEDVLSLTERYVKWDEATETFKVMGDNKQERLNASLRPMSVDEFLLEVAAKRPYLVRSDMKSGVGSTTGTNRSDVSGDGSYELTQIFGSKSDGAKATALYKKNPQEYHRLKAIAKESGVLAK